VTRPLNSAERASAFDNKVRRRPRQRRRGSTCQSRDYCTLPLLGGHPPSGGHAGLNNRVESRVNHVALVLLGSTSSLRLSGRDESREDHVSDIPPRDPRENATEATGPSQFKGPGPGHASVSRGKLISHTILAIGQKVSVGTLTAQSRSTASNTFSLAIGPEAPGSHVTWKTHLPFHLPGLAVSYK